MEFYKFYRHKRAIEYCGKNIFRIKALYSAAIPLLTVELVGVIFASIPLLILVRNISMGLMFAVIAVNSVVIYPGLLILVIFKQVTVDCVTNIAVELNGPPIVVLKDACPKGLNFEEFCEIVCLLMENGHIKDYRIEAKGLLVKNGITLTATEVREYLGITSRARGKKASRTVEKIVYELPDTGADSNCDNCGSAFDKDDSFCGYCGTVRKDVRRRI